MKVIEVHVCGSRQVSKRRVRDYMLHEEGRKVIVIAQLTRQEVERCLALQEDVLEGISNLNPKLDILRGSHRIEVACPLGQDQKANPIIQAVSKALKANLSAA